MAALSIEPGFQISDDLVVVSPLKQGGMGAVYVAEQKSTGRRRALKVMHREIVANPSLQRRFEQEARAAARIESEHVVQVLGTGVEPASGLPYIVMELLDGVDLGEYSEEHGPLEHDEVNAIFEQLCHGVGAAHAAGVVHRDLKPENVFLARPRRAGAERFMVKVLDFGIAKLAAEATSGSTTGAVGSPMWMAPEQTTPGPVTPATDVWALGLIAYRLLTGKNFWRGANTREASTAQLLREIVLDPMPRASERAREQGVAGELPDGFDAWFGRAVAREPRARFADALELRRALGAVLRPDAALANTQLEPSGSLPPVSSLAATDAATPFESKRPEPGGAGSTPQPARSDAPPPATPIATVQPRAVAPNARAQRMRWIGASAIGVGGVALGLALAHGMAKVTPRRAMAASASAPAAALPPAASSAAKPPAPSATTTASVAPPSSASAAESSQPSSSTLRALHKSASVVPARSSSKAGHAPGVVWTVGEHRHVRLIAYLVSNQSNVADAVVRKAIEWDSWQYLQCYQQFGGLKQMPEGTVTIGFEILDQLPQHARVQSSTISTASFNECVLRVLLGQTINAAGPDGKGHAVYAFRFVSLD
jgi:eukaryotic-like serine/threonine-protein kinase